MSDEDLLMVDEAELLCMRSEQLFICLVSYNETCLLDMNDIQMTHPKKQKSDVALVGKQQPRMLANTLEQWNHPYVLTHLVDYVDKEPTNAPDYMAAGYTQALRMTNDGLCIHAVHEIHIFLHGSVNLPWCVFTF